jgi:hypothetical protein
MNGKFAFPANAFGKYAMDGATPRPEEKISRDSGREKTRKECRRDNHGNHLRVRI